MITINYTKTIYILTDPDNDSIYDCENDSYLVFPSLDIHNDWWCFYKNDRLNKIGIFESYQAAVEHVKLQLDNLFS